MTMTSQDSSDLQRVAEAIADGTAVDWHDVSLARDSLRSRLDRLRVVEKIRTVHHAPLEATAEPARTPTTQELLRTTEDAKTQGDPPFGPSDIPGTWGPLEIIERIGCGGYGEVFRARDPALQKDVALKLLHAWSEVDEDGAIDERYLTEGRRLAAVHHENVLTVHGAARHDGRVGLWTDLVDGQTLEQCLASQGPMGHKEASVIGMDLCRALAAVHREGMVHGDVKASNVMREAGSGKIILMDFSSARERLAAIRDTGVLCGTPIYMAPELLRGHDAGVTSDVYSLGVLLYRLVTRRFPVEAGSIRELLDKMEQGEVVPIREIRPDLPQGFIRVIERALAAEPRRYHSVADMERDLARELEPKPEPTRINPWMALAGVAAIVAIFLLQPFFMPFSVEASLHRDHPIGSHPLADGALVSPGDKLFLEIDGNKRMHVYVINVPENEPASVMFPLPGFDLQNPVPSGKHRLPGVIEGEDAPWEVHTATGPETILVVASLTPLEELERSMAQMARAQDADAPAGPANTRAIDRYRRKSSPQNVEGVLALIADADPENNDDIWVWRHELNNPHRSRSD